MPAIPRTAVSFFQTILLTRVNIFWPGFRARTPPGACGLVLYWRGWGPAPSILTLSTGYQRPHPRIITRSCPFLLLIATTGPMGQLTRVVPRKAWSRPLSMNGTKNHAKELVLLGMR